LLSLLAVVVSDFLARATRLPLPLMIALGAAIPLTRLSSVELNPALFLLLLLPPLLFLEGWRIPKDALRRDAHTMLKLALGLVIFTVVGMGFFIHWLIPSMPLAVCFALAAVISPTDAVAVSAIAARTPIPQRLMHILQGEALFNDATGLVCMRFAVAAALTGSFSLGGALTSFLWVALGGLAIGAGVTWLVAQITARVAARWGEDGGGQILITLLIPFGVYLLAERLHCSGILAAVAAGVTLSFSDVWQWHATTRLRRHAVWDTLQLAANGSIFVLLGEQIPALLAAAPRTALETGHTSAWWLRVYVLLIVLALSALRFAWVWASLKMTFIGALHRGDVPPSSSWKLVLVATLAGVRGTVTLAGVLTLPVMLASGAPIPARNLAIALAAGVIVVLLLLASLTLPGLLRDLSMPPEPSHRRAEDSAREAAAEAAVLAIEGALREMLGSGDDRRRCNEAAARITALYRQRIGRWGHHDSPAARAAEDQVERQLRRIGLAAERAEILRLGASHAVGDLWLRRVVRELDLQEARFGA